MYVQAALKFLLQNLFIIIDLEHILQSESPEFVFKEAMTFRAAVLLTASVEEYFHAFRLTEEVSKNHLITL